jgi:hypothetical protein
LCEAGILIHDVQINETRSAANYRFHHHRECAAQRFFHFRESRLGRGRLRLGARFVFVLGSRRLSSSLAKQRLAAVIG